MSTHHDLLNRADFNTDIYGLFPVVCPYGGGYSLQLGNSETGKQADAVSYTFQVPPSLDTFTLTFFYAVVLQNPGHTAEEQPRFTVTASNAFGTIVNCSNFDFVASGAIPGFKTSVADPSVLYKEWTPASLQFAGMAGTFITLQFQVSDCTRGGHFGYAYVDVSANCTGQLATASYCPDANALVLNAPYGFETYKWYNHDFTQVIGSGQTVTLSPPPVTSGYYWVSMVPYPGYGCPDTVKAVVEPYPMPPPPVVQDLQYCRDQPTSPLRASALPGYVLMWYPSQSAGVGSPNAPMPSTSTLGTQVYWVSQKQLFGCESIRVPVQVHITGPVPLSMTVNEDRQCLEGNSFVFTNTSPAVGSSNFFVLLGNGEWRQAPPGVPIRYTYPEAGSYQAVLSLANSGVCTGVVPHPVVVVPRPVARIGGPPSICIGASATLADSSLVPGSSVAEWWWNVGGNIATTSHPPLPAQATGAVQVALVVTTAEGCRSDTAFKTLPVHDRPVAAFTFSGRCDNELLRLRDHSQQPPNTRNEVVSAWHWSVDGAPLSTLQNPDVLIAGGTRAVRLVAENNFGCTSDPVEHDVTLLPHPRIALQATDSCAGKPVQFNTQVLSGSIRDWRWNYGAGWITGGSSLTQTFLQAGPRPVQLISVGDNGCNDTLQHNFMLYGNNAVAGNDTAAAIGEPVQLVARGDNTMRYTWSPVDGLTDPTSARTLALWPADMRYELLAVDRRGCESHTAIWVRRYAGPDLYVPSAFTPNGDGRNDRLHVLPVGIQKLHYFAVYSRSGRLLFRTASAKEGWDGRYEGVVLGAQTVVYVAEGTDYKGAHVLRRGVVTLLR
ncbi:MAG: T9SS type B sorting domain-containing protein [Sphingobacteriales bacterium]|nr:MAG: T9SS type B sorting domain-containing protein [Sphingobacteriales bacterium]